MALSQSVLSDLLDEFRANEGVEREPCVRSC